MTHPKNNKNSLGVYQIQFTSEADTSVIKQPLFLNNTELESWMHHTAHSLLFTLLFNQMQLHPSTQREQNE